MPETLLKKLMNKVVLRVNAHELRPTFYDILDALNGIYLVLRVSGDDGGEWLYFISEGTLQERSMDEVLRPEFRAKHFVLAMPDWTLYDIILKRMTPAEATAYATWGGTNETHPNWVMLQSEQFLNLIATAVHTL